MNAGKNPAQSHNKSQNRVEYSEINIHIQKSPCNHKCAGAVAAGKAFSLFVLADKGRKLHLFIGSWKVKKLSEKGDRKKYKGRYEYSQNKFYIPCYGEKTEQSKV